MRQKKKKMLTKFFMTTLYIILSIIAIISHGISINTLLEIPLYAMLGIGLSIILPALKDDLKEIFE